MAPTHAMQIERVDIIHRYSYMKYLLQNNQHTIQRDQLTYVTSIIQVAWATSSALGCGAFRCAQLQGISGGGANWINFVCNYGPG